MEKEKTNTQIANILIIILFSVVVSLPFVNKAYHVDDTIFLYIADQIANDPLRPYSFSVEWGTQSGPGAYLMDTPLVPYYTALISWIFYRSETILHLSFIIFHIIAGLSFYFIAKKFIEWPLPATLILVATPTFLVNSQNLMLDVPMLSLFLLASALFLYGVDKGNHKLLFFGSLTAGFAYLAKPNAIIIIPLLLLYCFLKKKQKYMFYQLIPVMFIILFSLHNYFIDGRLFIKDYIPFLVGKKGSSFNVFTAFIFSNLSYIGGATIFPLFFLYPFLIKKRNFIFISLSIIIAAIVSVVLYQASSNFVSGKYTLFQISLFFVFITSSIFFIILLIAENYNNIKSGIKSILGANNIYYNIDMFFIFVWFVGVYILNSGLSGGAVRYNTLFLPPLILSYFILLKKYKKQSRINMFKLSVLILVSTAFIGLIVAYADYDYANSYRDFVNKIPQAYKTESNIVHFSGSGGFQYYMIENGYRILLKKDNSPKKGDIVIKARLPSPRPISNELMQRMTLVETITYDGRIPVRTQNPKAHAGFYTYAGGLLPYSFSNSKLEHFDIYYVQQ